MGRRSKQLITKASSSQVFEELKKVILGLWAIIKDLFHYIKTLDFQGLRKEWNKIRKNKTNDRTQLIILTIISLIFVLIMLAILWRT